MQPRQSLWTNAETETLKGLLDRGQPWRQIAKELGRTENSAKKRWRTLNEGSYQRIRQSTKAKAEDKAEQNEFSKSERATAKLLVLLRKHHDFDVRIPAHVKPKIDPPAEQNPQPILENDALPAEAVEAYRTHEDAIAKIKRIVGKATGVSLREMMSPDRGKTVVRSRQIAIYLAKRLTGRSWNEVARRFNRDHTTAIHAITAIEKQIKSDPLFAAKVDRLMEEARAAA